jgi:mannose-6-phosphate isomerase-like protein (cupin superfamily)
MRRRLFISLLGGVATWPVMVHAQQPPAKVRRIGVLMSTVENDRRGLESITAFTQGLAELGWIVGRDVRIEYRWGAGDLDRFRRYAAELVALSPDVVLATAGSIVGAFQQASRAAPGFNTGAHYHTKIEEIFYVLEGELDLRCGERIVRGGPGTCVFVPPGAAHAFGNSGSAPGRMLLITAPPGHERYFDELRDLIAKGGKPDPDALAKLRAKYDTVQLATLTPG